MKSEMPRLLNSENLHFLRAFSFAPLHLCVFALILLSLSCGSKPTDMRTLVPAETLVYLETNDLGAALQPIIDSKPFNEVAKSKPDLSALKGVQLAVAVTGFETTEEKLTDEHSVGRIQPHFVAIADTHAWQFQTVRFAEKKLGSFVAEMYDSEPTLESSEKGGGHYLVWTAKDGRKAFAVVSRSLIYFGNDESAIEKCLAIERGEADSIAKAGKVPLADPATLASGYVGPDGIAQIANIVGLKFASEAGEDSEVRSAIAGILPRLLRNSVTEIRWTATKTEQGIEDNYRIGMPPEIADVFSDTMFASGRPNLALLNLLPDEFSSTTVYDFRDPKVAWRSFVELTQKQLNPLAAKILSEISQTLFEPYGIKDGELFLSSVGPTVVTIDLGEGGDQHVVIATVKNAVETRKSISQPLKAETIELGDGKMDIVRSEDGELAAQFWEDKIILGETQPFLSTVGRRSTIDERKKLIERFNTSSPTSFRTMSIDNATAAEIADLLSARRSDLKTKVIVFSETRFTKSGMERKTTSDFGLIGSIIAQLAQD